MTSQTEKKKHLKYTYCSSVARSKSNETIKYGQLLEYSVWNIYFSKSCREWDWETRSRPLLVLQKRFTWGKNKWSVPWFNMFW